MLPVTIDRLGRAGAGMVLEAGEAGVRKLIGMPPISSAESAERQAITAASPGGRAPAMQDTVRTIMGGALHKPETTAGTAPPNSATSSVWSKVRHPAAL
jgi:hypothetical protein